LLAVKIANPFLRVVAAVLASVVVALVLFVICGVILPVWVMDLSYGAQRVLDAPGHGSAILFLTVPIAGLICFFAMIGFGVYFYEKFTR
jgi:hypothetical protein